MSGHSDDAIDQDHPESFRLHVRGASGGPTDQDLFRGIAQNATLTDPAGHAVLVDYRYGFPLPLRAGNLDIRDAMPAQSQAKYRVVRDLRDI
jgi:hypothetical protein